MLPYSCTSLSTAMPNIDGIHGIPRKDKPDLPDTKHESLDRPLSPLEKYKEALRRRLGQHSERADHSRFRTKQREDESRFWEE